MKIRKQQEPSEEPQYQPNRAERRRWLNDVKRQMRRGIRAQERAG